MGVHGSVTLGARALVRASAAPEAALWAQVSAAPYWKRLTVSTPAATKTSPSPALMAWAAMRMVCRGEEQSRFAVTPGRAGAPAAVVAGLAAGLAGAHEDVFDLLRIELGHLGQDFFDDEPGQVIGPTIDQG